MSDATARATIDDLLTHRRWVRTLALRLTSDESAADDLEQEAWLAALRATPPAAGSARAWFGAVVRNLARNTRRGAGRRGRRETVAAAPARAPAASPED